MLGGKCGLNIEWHIQVPLRICWLAHKNIFRLSSISFVALYSFNGDRRKAENDTTIFYRMRNLHKVYNMIRSKEYEVDWPSGQNKSYLLLQNLGSYLVFHIQMIVDLLKTRYKRLPRYNTQDEYNWIWFKFNNIYLAIYF